MTVFRGHLVGIRCDVLDLMWFILTPGLGLELWFGLGGDVAQGLGPDLDPIPKLQILAGHVTQLTLNLTYQPFPGLGLNDSCRRKAYS